MMSSSMPRYRAVVAAVSLVAGPFMMSVGDLLHPKESMDATEQASIIFDHASRWYAAHLLLFLGILAFVPGILALTSLTAERNRTAGYVARILILAGVGAFSAVFVCEMLIGRYMADGAGVPAVTGLLTTFASGWVLGAVMAGAVAFFTGVGFMTIRLVRAGGELRWPAVGIIIGALLILGEIITSEVLLSQVGNIVLLMGSAAFARQIVRNTY